MKQICKHVCHDVTLSELIGNIFEIHPKTGSSPAGTCTKKSAANLTQHTGHASGVVSHFQHYGLNNIHLSHQIKVLSLGDNMTL